jgi:transposase InsO family protein
MTYIPIREGWLTSPWCWTCSAAASRAGRWARRSRLSRPAARSTWRGTADCPPPGLLFHSDRGSQYASRGYTDLFAGHGIRASMSRKGNCWDNTCAKTLFGSLKVERLHGMEFQNHREAKDATLDRQLWYNRSRMHSTLDYLSPSRFEQQSDARKLSLAA